MSRLDWRRPHREDERGRQLESARLLPFSIRAIIQVSRAERARRAAAFLSYEADLYELRANLRRFYGEGGRL